MHAYVRLLLSALYHWTTVCLAQLTVKQSQAALLGSPFHVRVPYTSPVFPLARNLARVMV